MNIYVHSGGVTAFPENGHLDQPIMLNVDIAYHDVEQKLNFLMIKNGN